MIFTIKNKKIFLLRKTVLVFSLLILLFGNIKMIQAQSGSFNYQPLPDYVTIFHNQFNIRGQIYGSSNFEYVQGFPGVFSVMPVSVTSSNYERPDARRYINEADFLYYSSIDDFPRPPREGILAGFPSLTFSLKYGYEQFLGGYVIYANLVPGTSLIAGPKDTVLDSVTVMCRNGSVTTYPIYAIDVDQRFGLGKALIAGIDYGFESGVINQIDCTSTYNFVPLEDYFPPPTFSGILKIEPAVQYIEFGINRVEYNVIFTPLSNWVGNVYLFLEPGTCPPGANCSFPEGDSFFLTNYSPVLKKFRIETTNSTPVGSYNFKINAAPNPYTTPIFDNASLVVVPLPVSLTPQNKAYFIRYENVTTTMQPNETRQVKVIMANYGSTIWTPDKYFLHSHNPINNLTWGINKIEIDKNKLGLNPSSISARYVRIKIVSNYTDGLGRYFFPLIGEIEFYDKDGKILMPHPARKGNYGWPDIYPMWTDLRNAFDSNEETFIYQLCFYCNQEVFTFDFKEIKKIEQIRIAVLVHPYLLNLLSTSYIEIEKSNDNIYFEQHAKVQIGDLFEGPQNLTENGSYFIKWYNPMGIEGKTFPYARFIRIETRTNPPPPYFRTWGQISDIRIFSPEREMDYEVISAWPNTDEGCSTAYLKDQIEETKWCWGSDNVYYSTDMTVILDLHTVAPIKKIIVNGFYLENLYNLYPRTIISFSLDGFRWKRVGYIPNAYFGYHVFNFGNDTIRAVPFTFNITAPSLPGNYPFQWRMHQEEIEDFDDSTPLLNIEVKGIVDPPIVDLKANGVDDLTIFKGDNLKLSWVATNNPDQCFAEGNWSGIKLASGEEERTQDAQTTGSKRYKLTCSNAGGSNSDEVIVNVVDPPPVCDINAVGENRFAGCIWKWDETKPWVSPPNLNDFSSYNWILVGQAPTGPTLSSPISTDATALNQNWGLNGPGVNDHFMIIWRGNFNFGNSGKVTFISGSDDGHLFYYDNNLIRNDWRNSSYNPQEYKDKIDVNSGRHLLDIYFYEDSGQAAINFGWEFPKPPNVQPTYIQEPDYCQKDPFIFFNWQYSDPDGDPQKYYQVQVDDSPDFSSPEWDSGKRESSATTTVSDKLSYNKTYYWRVKVWDETNLESPWVQASQPFSTPNHPYPRVAFSFSPERINVSVPVRFFNESTVYDGVNNPSLLWTFEGGTPSSSNSQNPVVTFNSTGEKRVSLTVTDISGHSCTVTTTIYTSFPLPFWREIKPTFYIEKFLAFLGKIF